MKNHLSYIIIVLLNILCQGITADPPGKFPAQKISIQEPVDYRQLLNGRIWRNEHLKVEGDQFFLSPAYLPGSVVFNGKLYENLNLRFDIASDELIMSMEDQPIIILNKEMVDSFDLLFIDRVWHFINAGYDTANILQGYVTVLYDGPTSMFVKYQKRILPLAVDGKADLFYQEHKVYVKSSGELVQVNGKRDFLGLMDDKKIQIKRFIRESPVKPVWREPLSFLPVLIYYDEISR
jgi:hypothetical protein